jgi:hypothetical protein
MDVLGPSILLSISIAGSEEKPCLNVTDEPAFDVTPLWIKFLWAMRASHRGRLRSQGRRESHSQAALLAGCSLAWADSTSSIAALSLRPELQENRAHPRPQGTGRKPRLRTGNA